ncbi:MAG: tetraacyldisaccharide 4'-kinase [Phycisphaeraceae bacterium]|nr:tetraacyldisaccharide 4'-kinase [Phycisphaerae bacterium]MBX3393274.1 tetraacyldisaccharide 4'-kinase [Phycisphaeraceae bacterium]
MRRRNRLYDRGVGVARFLVPVVSVGNLSVGGTGKTPAVRAFVRWMLEDGRRPAIAMRGYRAPRSADPLASTSDEAVELRRTLGTWPDGTPVPVLAHPDRTAAITSYLGSPAGSLADRIVLDDGFQHRRIARDLDVVLIDATRDPWRDRPLPLGLLREPVKSLDRAGAIVVTHAEMVPEGSVRGMLDLAANASPRAVLASCRHGWTSLVVESPEGAESRPVRWLHGKRVLAVCAIGNPAAFLAGMDRAIGGPVAGSVILRDHDPYSPRTIQRIIAAAHHADAEVVLTTEKDWGKLARTGIVGQAPPIARPILELSFDTGGPELRRAILAAGS